MNTRIKTVRVLIRIGCLRKMTKVCGYTLATILSFPLIVLNFIFYSNCIANYAYIFSVILRIHIFEDFHG